MQYEIPENVKNNLILFLDRVPIKGHKERAAMNEILTILGNPIKEEAAE